MAKTNTPVTPAETPAVNPEAEAPATTVVSNNGLTIVDNTSEQAVAAKPVEVETVELLGGLVQHNYR